MPLTEFFLRHRAFAWVATVGCALLGWICFESIPRSEDPDLRVPAFSVVVVVPGLNPAELERLVARPIEDSVKELDDLQKLQTSIRDGLAVIRVEFTYGLDPDKKYDDVRRQVSDVRERLPAGVQRIEVKKVQTLNVALLQAALVSEDASYARLQDLAEGLRRRFEAAPGVRRAEKWAYPEKQVRVVLDLDALSQRQIGLDQIIGALEGNNTSVPAGSADLGARRFTVKSTGVYSSLDEVRQTLLDRTGTATLRLGDVANIYWDYEDLDYRGRFKGRRAVFVTVLAQRGSSALSLRDGLLKAAKRFGAGLPSDVALEVGFDQAKTIDARLNRLGRDFLFALALVSLTVLPLGIRASLLVGLSIPLSLALGVAALYFSGFSLNQLSIVGCVIALGLLVDDSIVVVENITRFRREGRSPREAVTGATRQITAAVAGTTAALLFAFLPLLMLPGGTGQFIRSFAAAVSYTVLASLAVSLTLVPFFASGPLAGGRGSGRLLRGLEWLIHAAYRPVLRAGMAHPKATLAAAAAVVLASAAIIPRLGMSLLPAADIPQFAIRVHGAEGASLAATDALVRRTEALLEREPEVDWWFANIGRGNPQIYYNEIPEEQSARIGDLFCSFKTADRRRNAPALARLRAGVSEIPGARFVVKEFGNGPPVEAPIAIRIFGEDLTQLRALGEEVADVLTRIPGTLNVDNPVRVARTDLRVRLDRSAAALLGVSERDVDRAARLAFSGLTATRFRERGGDEFNVTLVLPHGERATLENWAKLRLRSASGAWTPITQVARLEMESGPPVIQRYNRERCLTIISEVQTGYNTDRVTRQAAAALRERSWPPGCRFELGGEAESRKESFAGLEIAALLAAAGILAVLTLEFGSFRGALVVASVAPLGLLGGLLGLWVTGNTLSFTAGVGFIALTGIEIKNSILLVDFTNHLRASGAPLREAIERAGEIRFLPVVLTTLTALGALTPLAAARSALYSPIAIVIIGGLVSSLLLSRVVTPVLYSILPPPHPER